MIELDVPGLVIVAGQVLGISDDDALARLDVDSAQAALAEAQHAGQRASAALRWHRPGSDPASKRGAAAAAAVALMHALLRYPPFPGHGEQVAVAAGLQFLAVNGWQAELDVPRAAVIIIERLASGQLTPADAAAWLMPRLSPHPESPARDEPRQSLLPPGSRARRIMLAPVAAVRRRRRTPRPILVIAHGSADGPGGITTTATGFMPFTSDAGHLVALSRQEARRLGQPRGPEHFLLGLTGQGDGVAVKALQRLGISREAVRQQAEQITGQGRPQAPPARVPDTPQARRVWRAVVDEAIAHGHDYIGTEHLLLGLCDSDEAAAQALASLGAGHGEVRGAIAAVLAESGRERSA